MKKFIFFELFLLFSFPLFSQSWTIRINMGGEIGEVDCETTVITKQQFERLLNQRTALKEYAIVTFIDNLEMTGSGSETIINGTIPNFNGYYYCLVKITPLTDRGKQIFMTTGMGTQLLFGNSNTGVLSITFGNRMLTFTDPDYANLLGSNKFITSYNLCIGFVIRE
jgi:hypothetical protein